MASAGSSVEAGIRGDVRGDVEAARHVVEQQGGDAGHEDAGDRAAAGAGLEARVEGANKAPGHDSVVEITGASGEEAVRKVVVFVDQKVDLVSRRDHHGHQIAHQGFGVLVAIHPIQQKPHSR